MSAPVVVATFAKNSLEMKLAKTFFALSAGVIAAVVIGFLMRSLGVHENLVITVFGMGALSGLANIYVLLTLVLALRFKETNSM